MKACEVHDIAKTVRKAQQEELRQSTLMTFIYGQIRDQAERGKYGTTFTLSQDTAAEILDLLREDGYTVGGVFGSGDGPITVSVGW